MKSPNHYLKSGIQPLEYIIANDLSFIEGNIIKYVTRYKYKDGVEDLLKAQEYLKLLIEKYNDPKRWEFYYHFNLKQDEKNVSNSKEKR